MVGFDSIWPLSLLSAGVTLLMMGVVYALGSLLQNPQFTAWVKTEIYQVFVSIAIVAAVLFMIELIGMTPGGFSLSAAWMTSLSSQALDYSHPAINDDDDVFTVAQKYLDNLNNFDQKAVDGSRVAMGAFDVYSRYSKQPCIPGWLFCMLGQNGASFQPLSGASVQMQAMNVLLYSSLVSNLTVAAQSVFLEFLQTGFILYYLPIAIVLRSLPFMRQFGGGLIAISVSLFIVFPLLLFVESSFWNPYLLVSEENVENVDKIVSALGYSSDELSYGSLFFASGSWTFSDVLGTVDDIMLLCSAAFLVSSFLFAFNILAITASARAFGRLLGADVDLSRLAQIV